MRKLFILLILLFTTNVKALETTYYSDYGEFKDYQKEQIVADDLTEVESENRYLHYREERVDGGYYIYGQNDPNYPYIDSKDKVAGELSEWSKWRPEFSDHVVVEGKDVYEYSDMLGVRYIHFYNLSGSYGAFRISELDIKVNNQVINYSVYCSNCNESFNNYIHNGSTNENASVVYNGGYLRIDLGNYYSLDSININLYLYDVGYDSKNYTIAITRDISLDKVYSSSSYSKKFTNSELGDYNLFSINPKEMTLINPEYYDWTVTEELVTESFTRKVISYQLFRYYDILYKYYQLNNIYNEEYTLGPTDEFPLQSELYETYYRSRTRNRLIINSPIIINEQGNNILNFIDSTTDVSINGEVDYSKNGTYQIEVMMDGFLIKEDVTINIESNNVLPKEDTTNLEQEIETNDIKEDETKEIKEVTVNNVSKLENDIIPVKLEKKIDEKTEAVIVINEESKEEIVNEALDTEEVISKKSSFNIFLIIIIFLFMAMASIVSILKKKSN